MKYILIILLFTSVSFAQSIDIPKCKLNQKTTFEKVLYTELAVIGYGIFDYVAYNSFDKLGINMEHYRFLQGIVFSGINYLLAKYVSPLSAAGFTLQVWGGTPDLIYYGIDKVSGGFNGFSYGNEFAINKYYTHLNFMPTVLGQERVHGVDLPVNVSITTPIAILLQFLKL